MRREGESTRPAREVLYARDINRVPNRPMDDRGCRKASTSLMIASPGRSAALAVSPDRCGKTPTGVPSKVATR